MLIEKIVTINGQQYKHIISELHDNDKVVKSPYKYLQKYGTGERFTDVLTNLTDKSVYIEDDKEVDNGND